MAARRLRSLLQRFRPVLNAGRVSELVGELRWYGEIAGPPRDAEVLKEHVTVALSSLAEEVRDDEVVRSLLLELDRRHEHAHAYLASEMQTERYAAFSALLDDLVTASPVRRRPPEGPDTLEKIVSAAIKRVERRYRAALMAPEDLEGWHEVRKAAKAVRCTFESCLPAFPGVRDIARHWESVTEGLGAVQDSVIMLELLDELAERELNAGGEPGPILALRAGQQTIQSESLQAGIAALENALAAGGLSTGDHAAHPAEDAEPVS